MSFAIDDTSLGDNVHEPIVELKCTINTTRGHSVYTTIQPNTRAKQMYPSINHVCANKLTNYNSIVNQVLVTYKEDAILLPQFWATCLVGQFIFASLSRHGVVINLRQKAISSFLQSLQCK